MYFGNGMYQNTADSTVITEGSVITCGPPVALQPQDLSRVTCKHSTAIEASGYPTHPMSEPCPLGQALQDSVNQVCRLLESI